MFSWIKHCVAEVCTLPSVLPEGNENIFSVENSNVSTSVMTSQRHQSCTDFFTFYHGFFVTLRKNKHFLSWEHVNGGKCCFSDTMLRANNKKQSLIRFSLSMWILSVQMAAHLPWDGVIALGNVHSSRSCLAWFWIPTSSKLPSWCFTGRVIHQCVRHPSDGH